MSSQLQHGQGQEPLVYVGTYTGGASQGIYICRLDLETGDLRQIGVAENVENPSYLALDAARLRLFAVNERASAGGRVSAFAIEAGSGALSLVNQQDSGGGAPCYLSVDRSGRYLLVANYMGGNVAVIPVGEEGALGEPSDVVTHTGRGPHPERQEGPHPHCIVLDPANHFAYVPDLGLDRVLQYRFDQASGQLEANDEPWAEASPASGPRHLVFHPTLKRAYVINELRSTVTVYRYDDSRGTLASMQTVTTLPEVFTGANLAADLHLTPDGRFLYGSNRGHDSVARFAVDQESGKLSRLGFTSTGGRRPRGFAVDPSGRFLLVANQDSHHLVTFRLNKANGDLTQAGRPLAIPSPVCLKFLVLPAG